MYNYLSIIDNPAQDNPVKIKGETNVPLYTIKGYHHDIP